MARPKSNGKGKGARATRSRRKSEDKADTVEVTKASELDLQAVVIKDTDFDLHFKAVKSSHDRMKDYAGMKKASLKHAKEVSPELHDAITTALSFESKDMQKVRRKLEIAGYVLRRTDAPIQLTIHNALLGDVTEVAEKRGYADAKAGRAAESPYPKGSDLNDTYMKGWQRGTGENMGMTEAEFQAHLDDRPATEGHNGPPEYPDNEEGPEDTGGEVVPSTQEPEVQPEAA